MKRTKLRRLATSRRSETVEKMRAQLLALTLLLAAAATPRGREADITADAAAHAQAHSSADTAPDAEAHASADAETVPEAYSSSDSTPDA